MNPWDFVTWLASVALAVSAGVIFGFFLRDARGILQRERHSSPDDSERATEADDSARTTDEDESG